MLETRHAIACKTKEQCECERT